MKRILILLLLSIVATLIWSSYPFDTAVNAVNFTQVSFDPGNRFGPNEENVDSINVPVDYSKPLVRAYKVNYGDSFHQILKTLNLPVETANSLAYNIGQVFDLKKFQVGQTYDVYFDKQTGDPYKLIYDLKDKQELLVDFRLKEASVVDKVIVKHVRSLKTNIQSSLAQTVINQNAPEDLADKILSVLAWKIDFQHLVPSDHFSVIYEEESHNGEVIGTGDILYVAFNHDGITYRGFGFDNGDGTEYFDEQGKNLSHAPLRFDLITSLYAQKRLHPVRRSYRAHYGMDFEAREGTPIEAAKDGIITRAQYGRANGHNIKIDHSADLTTQYLHLSKIDSSIHVGDSVKYGQVIGYVGSTGLSSGPHLCLRVWYKGRQRDPLNFDFPRRADIRPELMQTFIEHISQFEEKPSF
ncbi:MAG: M23 family metallopeptidase [Marinoscillum sp.]